jgi:isochorismate synthase
MEKLVQNKELLDEVLDVSLQKKIHFAIYRLPGEEDVEYVAQLDNELIELKDLSDVPGEGGFLIAPFSFGADDKTFLIRPDIAFKNVPSHLQIVKLQSVPVMSRNGVAHFSPEETRKDEYIQQIEQIIEKIKKGEYEKVVLSRVKRVDGIYSRHLTKIFRLLCDSYPNAFVYLLRFKDQCWAGASPEPLIFSEAGQLVTVSLAGTRAYSESNLDITHWNQKERMEQEYVTQYIEKILKEYSIEQYLKIGPYIKKAGKILHLRTDFSFSFDSIGSKLPSLVKALHPTSAVCGMPMEKSLTFLGQIERHNREYYAGYLGPVGMNEGLQLFVNLRCMKVFENQLALYVGGGITLDSNPEDEWEETEIKAETLLSVLNQIH